MTALGSQAGRHHLKKGLRRGKGGVQVDRMLNLGVKRLKLITLMQFSFPSVCIYGGDEAGLEGYSDPCNRGTYPGAGSDADILDWHMK